MIFDPTLFGFFGPYGATYMVYGMRGPEDSKKISSPTAPT
jgi:hypothetical protein